MIEFEVFVVEFLTVNRLTTGAIVVGKVTTLAPEHGMRDFDAQPNVARE